MKKRIMLLALCLLAAAVSSLDAQDNQKRRFPYDANQTFAYPTVHDPVVASCDGRYYVFATGMAVLSSNDMENWKFERRVLDATPQWALDKGFRGMLWAPDIQYFNGLWYIYYSYSSFGKNRSAIGVATNRTLNPESPDFKWEDRGMILESVPGRDDWNAIDANVTLDGDGNGWMVFGSFWSGIKITRLDSTLTRLSVPQVWHPVCSRPREMHNAGGNGAVEAPFIIKRGEWYYLFVSFDYCCRGEKSNYNVVVGRSKSICVP